MTRISKERKIRTRRSGEVLHEEKSKSYVWVSRFFESYWFANLKECRRRNSFQKISRDGARVTGYSSTIRLGKACRPSGVDQERYFFWFSITANPQNQAADAIGSVSAAALSGGNRASTASSIHVSIRFGPPSGVEDWYVLSGGRCHLLSIIRSR